MIIFSMVERSLAAQHDPLIKWLTGPGRTAKRGARQWCREVTCM